MFIDKVKEKSLLMSLVPQKKRRLKIIFYSGAYCKKIYLNSNTQFSARTAVVMTFFSLLFNYFIFPHLVCFYSNAIRERNDDHHHLYLLSIALVSTVWRICTSSCSIKEISLPREFNFNYFRSIVNKNSESPPKMCVNLSIVKRWVSVWQFLLFITWHGGLC